MLSRAPIFNRRNRSGLVVRYALMAFGIVAASSTSFVGSAVAQQSTSKRAPSVANPELDAGRREMARGSFRAAVPHLQAAVKGCGENGDVAGQIDALVNLAAAYQLLGQPLQASRALGVDAGIVTEPPARWDRGALSLIGELNDVDRRIRIETALGGLCIAARSGDEARKHLSAALDLATQNNRIAAQSLVRLNLGNLRAAEIQRQTLAEEFQATLRPALQQMLGEFGESLKLAEQANDRQLAARAATSAASAVAQAISRIDDEKNRTGFLDVANEAAAINDRARDAVLHLKDGYEKSHLLINVGDFDGFFARLKGGDGPDHQRLIRKSYDAYQLAIQIADAMKDRRAASYGYGHLSQLYESEKRWDEALSLARKAVANAEQAQEPAALYRWQWQVGRVQKSKGDREAAIKSYRGAVETLQSIREDVAASTEAAGGGSSYREAVGSLYFELADLLLGEADALTDDDARQSRLREARATVELLKVAELDDYFLESCAKRQPPSKAVDEVAERTAVVYLMPLPDRTEILLGVGSRLEKVRVDADRRRLDALVKSFRQSLETRTTRRFMRPAQELYDLLIRPIEARLSQSQVETLVLIPDGSLMLIPFGALHDGKSFLVERYAVSINPGLTLVDPSREDRSRLSVLLAGLSEDRPNFPALLFVPEELRAVRERCGGRTLFNQDFQLSRLDEEMAQRPYSVVHIASHGQFVGDSRKSFIVTHAEEMYPDDLRRLLLQYRYREQPVDLLTLSACETAADDDRAALGLAGIGIKAGARSALATLWSVDDKASAELMGEFYTGLRDSTVSKAKALQAAQLKLLRDPRYRHPCYWAPYLIIGNWL